MKTRTLFATTVFLLACSRENNVQVGGGPTGGVEVGKTCSTPQDCAGGVCLAGVCRTACKADVECEAGSLCLSDGSASGCRLATEATCDTPGKPCTNGALVCGLDKTCRQPCTSKCARAGQSCIAGACVDEAEPGAAAGYFSCQTANGLSGKLCVGKILVSCNETAPGKTTLATCSSDSLCTAAATAGASACAAPLCTPGTYTCGGKAGATLQRCNAGGTAYDDVDASHDCATASLCALTKEATEKSGALAPCVAPMCAVGEGACKAGAALSCNVGRTGFDVVATCVAPAAQCNPGAMACVSIAPDSTEVTRDAYRAFLDAIGDADAPGALAMKPPVQPAACKSNLDFTPTAHWTALDQADGKAPVSGVDWCDARAYCASIGKRLCGRIGGGSLAKADFSDPGKSEWMNACSSGGQHTHPFGEWKGSSSEEACNGAGNWLAGDTPAAVSVGSKNGCASAEPGYAGVYDLSGNVAEWEDACDASADAGTPSDGCRVRGGSFESQTSMQLACAADRVLPRNQSAPDVGFRCCH